MQVFCSKCKCPVKLTGTISTVATIVGISPTPSGMGKITLGERGEFTTAVTYKCSSCGHNDTISNSYVCCSQCGDQYEIKEMYWSYITGTTCSKCKTSETLIKDYSDIQSFRWHRMSTILGKGDTNE
jgi:hypothetical protein